MQLQTISIFQSAEERTFRYGDRYVEVRCFCRCGTGCLLSGTAPFLRVPPAVRWYFADRDGCLGLSRAVLPYSQSERSDSYGWLFPNTVGARPTVGQFLTTKYG